MNVIFVFLKIAFIHLWKIKRPFSVRHTPPWISNSLPEFRAKNTPRTVRSCSVFTAIFVNTHRCVTWTPSNVFSMVFIIVMITQMNLTYIYKIYISVDDYRQKNCSLFLTRLMNNNFLVLFIFVGFLMTKYT